MTLFHSRLCSECGVVGPHYKGVNKRCAECHKARVKARARSNPAVQEYDRLRSKLPHRVEARARISRAWREAHPEAYKAQTAVNNAVRDGRLFKGKCEVCGWGDVHAHHEDYAKPLDVTWLCPMHHHRLHGDTGDRHV